MAAALSAVIGPENVEEVLPEGVLHREAAAAAARGGDRLGSPGLGGGSAEREPGDKSQEGSHSEGDP